MRTCMSGCGQLTKRQAASIFVQRISLPARIRQSGTTREPSAVARSGTLVEPAFEEGVPTPLVVVGLRTRYRRVTASLGASGQVEPTTSRGGL